MRLLPALLLILAFARALYGQTCRTCTISTFAGAAPPVDISGTSTGLGAPQAVAADSTGSRYILWQNTVMRMDSTIRLLSLIAGAETFGY